MPVPSRITLVSSSNPQPWRNFQRLTTSVHIILNPRTKQLQCSCIFSIGNVVSHQSHHGFLSQLWLCRGSRRHWPPRGRVSDCLRPNQTSECCGDFIDVFFGVMRTCVIGSLLMMLIIMACCCRVCYYVAIFVVGGVAVAAVLLLVVWNVVLSVVIVTVLILTSWGDHALHSDLNFRYRPSHQFPERIRCHLGTRHDTTWRTEGCMAVPCHG